VGHTRAWAFVGKPRRAAARIKRTGLENLIITGQETAHGTPFRFCESSRWRLLSVWDNRHRRGYRNPHPDVQNIIAQLGNLARSALEPVVRLDHKLEDWEGVKILIIHVSDRKQNQLCSGERI